MKIPETTATGARTTSGKAGAKLKFTIKLQNI